MIMLAGCQSNGFDLELHSPRELDALTRVELTIDLAKGAKPRHVSNSQVPHVGTVSAYAIDLDEEGKASINAAWPITKYHRTFLVTPSKRLQRNYDFQIADSGWIMAETTTRTANGVTSQTKLDGSKFWMEFKKLPSEQEEAAKGRGKGDKSCVRKSLGKEDEM
jgi:hypothetical protein